MSQLSVNTITNAAGGNTATINGMTPTGLSLQGFRNRIFNGGMVIDQRNNGASVTVNNAAPYTVDRWQAVAIGAGIFSAQRVTDAPAGFTNSLRITTTTADASITATDNYQLLQPIEGFNTADLGFGTASASAVTLSFWVKSSLTGTQSGSLVNGATNRSYVFTFTVSAANTWEYKTVTITGDTTGTWNTDNSTGISVRFNLGGGSDFQGAPGSWAAASRYAATGAVQLVGTLNATLQLTGCQLEAGAVATPFERRPYGTELALCQRYYYRRRVAGATQILAESGLVATTAAGAVVTIFPVEMRISPSALEQSGTAGDYQLAAPASLIACSIVPTLNVASTLSARTIGTVASGLVVGNATLMLSTNANAFLGWSAEL